jgi:hypothetical protein
VDPHRAPNSSSPHGYNPPSSQTTILKDFVKNIEFFTIYSYNFITINIKMSNEDNTIIEVNDSESTHDEEIKQEDLFDDDNEEDEEYHEFICKHLDILNAFHTYYRKHHKLTDKSNMFDGMDDYGASTNMISECLYNHLSKYGEIQKKNPKDLELFNPNDYDSNNIYSELFGLLIDGEIKFVSYSLISIIIYITDQENWRDINWYIIDIKI